MQIHRSSILLRRVLAADALICFTTGLLMTLGSDDVGQFSGLPSMLLQYAGISLIPLAVFLAYLARREAVSQSMVWTVIVLNVLWTAASFLLLLTGWAPPTGLGYVFIVAQAMGVAVFAALEYVGLRQSITSKPITA